MNFAGKKAYISNNRANQFVQLQAKRGKQINFAAHVPQRIQQVQSAPLPQAPLHSAPISMVQQNYQGQNVGQIMPPSAPNIIMQQLPKPKIERKRSFQMLEDCELNNSLDEEPSLANMEQESQKMDNISNLSKRLSVKNVQPKKKKGFIRGILDKFSNSKKQKQKLPKKGLRMGQPSSAKKKFQQLQYKQKPAPNFFKPIGEDVQECYEKEIDSNVMSINFNVLKETGEIASGDPVFCKQCGSIFNKFSKLIDNKELQVLKHGKKQQKQPHLSQIQEQLEESRQIVEGKNKPLFINQQQKKEISNDLIDLNQEEQEKKQAKVPLNDYCNIFLQADQQLWVCQFCHHFNIVQIEQQQIPSAQGINYILQSEVQAKEAAVGRAEHQDISIIFCVDISGSMCLTQEVKGKMKLKGMDTFKQVAKDLLKFGDGSDQYLQGESRNTTYISRMQCLQAAIDSQIQQMCIGAPKRLVGIVTFGSQVAIIGDGTQGLPKIIAGDRLNDPNFIKTEANKCIASEYLKKPIGQTSENLAKQVMMLEEGGSTALGPALLSAIQMATAGKRGSKVVVCTDGLANIGIGSLQELKSDEDHNAAKQFYQNCGSLAKENGVQVSVISIKGENCKLQYLTNIASESGGEVLIVDPENLAQEFSNILQNPVIATHVKAKVLLSKVMQFRNEKPINLTEDKSTLVREIGNVTQQTQITFEYTLKNAENLQKLNGVNIFQEKELSFQTQITYTALDGKKCVRVISSTQQVGFQKEEIQQEANVNILATHVQQQSAAIAKEGNYRKAQANMHFWGKKIQNSVKSEEDNRVYGQWKQSANLFSHNLQSAQEMEYQGAEQRKASGLAAPISMNNAMRGQMRSDSLSNEIYLNSNFQRASNQKSMGTRVKEFFSKKKK